MLHAIGTILLFAGSVALLFATPLYEAGLFTRKD